MADKYEIKDETIRVASILHAKLQHTKFLILTSSTGGGKTYISIETAQRLSNDVQKKCTLIVFAPKKKIDERDWEKSVASYNETMQTAIQLHTFNYEKTTSEKYKAYMASILDNCAADEHVIVILDEAHRIKEPQSKRFKYMQKLKEHPSCYRIIGLSATPVTNAYTDAVGYFILAGLYKNQTQFNQAHVKFYNDYRQPIVKRPNGEIDRNLFAHPEIIEAALAQVLINIEPNVEKPPVIETEYRFQLTKDEFKGYRQIHIDYRNGCYEHIQEATKYMREYVAMHSQQKLNTLSDILTHKLHPRKRYPVLIFYTYNADLFALRTHIERHHPDYDIIEINGHEKTTEADLLEPSNPNTIFLMQYVAGSAGLDAKWSNCTIFYAPTYSYQDYKQAKGRNVRTNQKTGEVYHIQFVLERTIDQIIWDTLAHKRDFTDTMMQKLLLDENTNLHDVLATIDLEKPRSLQEQMLAMELNEKQARKDYENERINRQLQHEAYEQQLAHYHEQMRIYQAQVYAYQQAQYRQQQIDAQQQLAYQQQMQHYMHTQQPPYYYPQGASTPYGAYPSYPQQTMPTQAPTHPQHYPNNHTQPHRRM